MRQYFAFDEVANWKLKNRFDLTKRPHHHQHHNSGPAPSKATNSSINIGQHQNSTNYPIKKWNLHYWFVYAHIFFWFHSTTSVCLSLSLCVCVVRSALARFFVSLSRDILRHFVWCGPRIFGVWKCVFDSHLITLVAQLVLHLSTPCIN